MRLSDRFQVNRTLGIKLIKYAITTLLALTAIRAHAAEALKFYGFDEASHSAAAEEGLQEIYSGRLFHQAIPVSTARLLFAAMSGSPKSLGYDPNSPEGKFYAGGRFPSPPNRTAGADSGFGLGESVFDRNGAQVLNINCFTCHAGVVNGQVVAGLGNNHINQSDPRRVRTRGDNFGPYAVWRLGAQLVDPAGQGMVVGKGTTELEKLLTEGELPPVDPMPWWLMKYKKMDYWYADSAPDNAASFSMNFTTSHAEMNADHADHVKSVAKALAFARETQSPLYPKSLDAELVQKGADLFHGRTPPADKKGFMTCKSCHGTYTKKPAQSDLTQPGSWEVAYNFSHVIRNPKTDPAYNTTLQRLKPIADHINKLEAYFTAQGTPELSPHASVPSKEGYVAPPLVGVWASAPYFHNGSVPTLEAVLNSGIRPEIWARENRDPQAYDLDKVGMKHRSVSREEFEKSAADAAGKSFLSQAALDYSAIYDTKGFGHGNMGHTFGDNLTADERRAVIEFLKSLSGPDM
jgi:mono/diheme cytochrome c family protein